MKKVIASVAIAALTLNVGTFASAKEHQTTHTKTVKTVKTATPKVKTVKTATGKSINKKLVQVDANVKAIEKAVEKYYSVDQKGKAKKKLSKTVANKKYTSFYGKYKAQKNQLTAIKKQLTTLDKKHRINASDYGVLMAKYDVLLAKVNADITNLKTYANQSVAKK
ncbi:hypothetical protein [Kurthia senegalensis]|uniref:hypothetical protein n=1 Tax=Kurthia senegalensis TaxID=1033740 RepID=UPI000288D6B4|nr:hypothetical protein [Kurthia senegalensis]